MSDIVVVGSASIDFNVTAPRLPRPGETVLGHRFFQVCGGKGANQAVAAARLGGRVAMVARVGRDAAGETILGALREAGVATRHVAIDDHAASGTAHIMVDDRGENAILVVPGSNAALSPADVDAARPTIAGAKVLLLQLEIPLETALHALRVAAEYGVPAILDPAPAPPQPLPAEFYRLSAWATPNESEAAALCGFAIEGMKSAAVAVTRLTQWGVALPVVKLGAGGCVYPGGHIPAFKVKALDTTAAGDAFAGALAVALVAGKEPGEALRFASAAGALTTTRYGAQPALPQRAEVDSLLTQGEVAQ